MRSSFLSLVAFALLVTVTHASADPAPSGGTAAAASGSTSASTTISVSLTKPGAELSAAEAQSVLSQYRTLELQLLTARQAAILRASQASDDADRRKILSDFANGNRAAAQTLHQLKAQIDQYNQVQPPASIIRP